MRPVHRPGNVAGRGAPAADAGPMPKVWIPSQRDFIHVAEIPITSTGKVDLRRLKQIARSREHAVRS